MAWNASANRTVIFRNGCRLIASTWMDPACRWNTRRSLRLVWKGLGLRAHEIRPPFVFVSLLAILVVGSSACTTVSEEAAFQNVAASVEKRIQHKVEWPRTAEKESAADKSIASLLGKGLTARIATEIALLNNRDLRATYSEFGIARAALLQSGLLPNPIANAVFRYPTEGGMPNLDFGLVFSFLDIMLMPFRRDIAKSEFERAKLILTREVIDLATRVRLAFYAYQAQRQLVGLFEPLVASSRASVAAAQTLHDAGNVTLLAVVTERVLFASSKLSLADARARRLAARENLNVLMGLSGASAAGWKVTRRLRRPPKKALAIDHLEEMSVERSLELKAAKQDLTTLERRYGVTKVTSVVGDVDVGAAAERDGGEWDVGPSVELPIPIFDMGQARRAQARSLVDRARHRARALAVKIRSSARHAAARLTTARRAVRAYRKEILPLTRTILDQTLRQYNAMQVGVLRLIQAKQQQISAGRRYIQSLHAFWSARTQVETLLAGIMPHRADAAVATPSASAIGSNRGGH